MSRLLSVILTTVGSRAHLSKYCTGNEKIETLGSPLKNLNDALANF